MTKIHLLLHPLGTFGYCFVAAALPLPYKIFSITSGVFDINLLIFLYCNFNQPVTEILFTGSVDNKNLDLKLKKLFRFNWKPIVILTTAGIALLIIFNPDLLALLLNIEIDANWNYAELNITQIPMSIFRSRICSNKLVKFSMVMIFKYFTAIRNHKNI